MQKYYNFLIGLLLTSCLSQHLFASYTFPDSTAQSSIATRLVGQGRLYKAVVFSTNVTVNDANNFALSATDAFEVQAEANDVVEIDAAGGITNITPIGTIDATATPAQKSSLLTLKDSDAGNVTIDGSVVIAGDLTVGGGSSGVLVINGDLIVTGSVTIQPNATVTVKGDIIFDGGNASGVTLAGMVTVEGIQNPLTNGSTINQGNLVIRNAVSSSTHAVTVSAAINATGNVIIENNSNTGGTGNGVLISNTIISDKSVDLVNNTSTTAEGLRVTAAITARDTVTIAQNTTSLLGEDGVAITAAVTATNGSCYFIGNKSTNGGSGTGKAVNISSVISALQDIVIRNNQASNTSAGANAFHVSGGGSVLASGTILIKNNTSNAAATHVGVDASGILGSHETQIVFDQAVSVPGNLLVNVSGLLRGQVIIQGDLTMTKHTVAAEPNDIDLGVEGNLTVLGGSMTFTSNAKLTVTGDIICDGQGKAKNISFDIGRIVGGTVAEPGARDFIVKNYKTTSGVTFYVRGNNNLTSTSQIHVARDIIIENNTNSNNSIFYMTDPSLPNDPAGVGAFLATGRDFIIRSNQTLAGSGGLAAFFQSGRVEVLNGLLGILGNIAIANHGMYFRGSMNFLAAHDIIVADNTGGGGANAGALIAKINYVINTLTLARNIGAGSGTNYFGGQTITARQVFQIYNNAVTGQNLAGTTPTYVDYYGGGTITPFNRNAAF